MARHLCFIFIFTIIGVRVRSSYEEAQSAVGAVQSPANEVEDNSRYKTLEANATLLKLLVNNKTGVSRSEVFDMLHSRDERADDVALPTFPQDNEDARTDFTNTPDSQAEYLQAPGEIVLRDDLVRTQSRGEEGSGEPVGLAAAIMVGVTCSVVCAAYASLIIWRRIELKRSGLKHELLRNEDVAETRIEL